MPVRSDAETSEEEGVRPREGKRTKLSHGSHGVRSKKPQSERRRSNIITKDSTLAKTTRPRKQSLRSGHGDTAHHKSQHNGTQAVADEQPLSPSEMFAVEDVETVSDATIESSTEDTNKKSAKSDSAWESVQDDGKCGKPKELLPLPTKRTARVVPDPAETVIHGFKGMPPEKRENHNAVHDHCCKFASSSSTGKDGLLLSNILSPKAIDGAEAAARAMAQDGPKVVPTEELPTEDLLAEEKRKATKGDAHEKEEGKGKGETNRSGAIEILH